MEKNDLEKLRHSLAHLLAAAVLKLYPETKLTLGPAIENGFYYDFDFGSSQPDTNTRMGTNDTNKQGTVSEKDLPKIEKEMRKILPSWEVFEHFEVTPEEAKKIFADNPYKLELIEEISAKGEPITLYYSGPKDSVPTKEEILSTDYGLRIPTHKSGRDPDCNVGATNYFLDLCRGGHVKTPSKEISPEAFKLDRIAGAYWRGDEKNKMLTRIYGIAFETKEDLEKYLEQKEEAKKRDHRKLGQEMDLFTFSDLVGSGLPLFTPKGTVLRSELQNALLRISEKYGMQPVTIPHIAKKGLYETSGHAQKFGDELIKVISHYDEFVMKPVNCPHHTQIYASRPRSYRDLPLRYMESTMMYRDEKPGEIGGLTRVRAITCDDGHIFCSIDQIKEEAKNIAKIIEEFYTKVGLFGNHWVSLSVRDSKHPENYIGSEDGWEKAESELQEISDELKLGAKRVEGEAAIYGPKLDYIFKDSLGREWQLATIQIDFAMPERFGLEYTDKDGSKKPPVIIHRAILGSYERFLAILIEHFAGAFPFWLSPVQIKILPIGESHREYAGEVFEKLKEVGVRVELDQSDESLGKKIRAGKTEKVPFLLVIGDKEMEKNQVTVEERGEKESKEMKLEELIENLKKKTEEKS